LLKLPTAVQATLAVHDTPLSKVRVEPVGLGVVCSDQVVPFHCSATVTPALGSEPNPTAVQALAELHDTLVR
jgi:hypothetical protein